MIRPIDGHDPAARASQALDDKDKRRLQRATKDFEAVFLGYVLKNMRQSLKKEDEMFGDSYGGDMLDGLFEAELARHVSRSSTFGLAEMLYKRITGEEFPKAGPAVPRNGIQSVPNGVPAASVPLRPAAAKSTAVGPTASAAPQGPAVAIPDSVRRRVEAYAPHIAEAAERHGVDANLLRAVIAGESGGRANAQSHRDAKGLMQLIDSTAASMGVRDVWDPRENILGGARYLQQLMGRFDNDLQRVLASYNAGPAAVERFNGIPPYEETRTYVEKVLSYLRFYEQESRDDG